MMNLLLSVKKAVGNRFMYNIYNCVSPSGKPEGSIKVVTNEAYKCVTVVTVDNLAAAVVHLDPETAYAVALSLLVAIKELQEES